MSEIDSEKLEGSKTSNSQKTEENGHTIDDDGGKTDGGGAPLHDFDAIDLDFGDASAELDPGHDQVLEKFLDEQGIDEHHVEVRETPKATKKKSSKEKTNTKKKRKVPKNGKDKEKMDQILADAKIKARKELEAEKDRIYHTVPHSIQNMWGQCGFAKWGKGFLPALSLDPYKVPPGPARQQWMDMFEKYQIERRDLETMSYLVYWYGEQEPSNYYSVVANSNFRKYDEAKESDLKYAKGALEKQKKGKKLSKADETKIRAWTELNEDLGMKPEDRKGGDKIIVERDQLLSLDDVYELYEEQGIEDDGDSDEDKDLAPKISPIAKKRKFSSKAKDEKQSQSDGQSTKRKKKKGSSKKSEAISEPGEEGEKAKSPGKSKRRRTAEANADEDDDNDQSTKSKPKSKKRKKAGEQSGADEADDESATSKKLKVSEKKKSATKDASKAIKVSKKKVNRNKTGGALPAEEPKGDDPILDIGDQELEDTDENDEDYEEESKAIVKKKKKKKTAEKTKAVDPLEKFKLHFLENEDAFEKLLSKWRDAINARKNKSVLKCLAYLKDNVKAMCFQFIVSYNLNSYLIQSKQILKQKNEDITLLKETRLTIKEHYAETKKHTNSEFKPEIRFPELAEAFESSPPFSLPPPKPKEKEEKVESEMFESQDTKIEIPPSPNDSRNNGDNSQIEASETSKIQSNSAAQTSSKITSDKTTVNRPKVKVEKAESKIPRFSLGNLTRKRDAIRGESSGATSTSTASDKKPQVDWFTDPSTLEVPSDPDRLLGLEFLRQMGSHFPCDKVNAETMAVSIERALQEWASKAKPAQNQRSVYWERLHAIVAAACGDGTPGPLMHMIVNGQVKSAFDLVQLPEATLLESFKGKHVTL